MDEDCQEDDGACVQSNWEIRADLNDLKDGTLL
uniref:Uncharacterized protein n=1 Tax=Physcomitrium patens TaxID=3218 RepID=A0A2K1JPC6_PHYPA|nr:hypothetical protein PHYPA_015774 [Physcomitrium patens]